MASTTSKIVTYEEWLQMPESKTREEVVDGEIIHMPAPSLIHFLIGHRLQKMLDANLDPAIAVAASGVFDLVIREEPLVCRQPDIVAFLLRNLVQQDGKMRSAPELVVEILSPSNTKKE